jgi:hypothetical protein
MAMLLIAGGLGTLVYAEDEPSPWEDDILKFETHNWYGHTPPGDIFTNSLVDGSMFWGINSTNERFVSEAVITGLKLTLASELGFTWYPILASDPGISIDLIAEDPPIYQWSFGDVGVGNDVSMMVHPTDPSDSAVTFEPGFDIVRWVDKTEFSLLDGTQTQTLTIVITPREDYTNITNNMMVQIAADENFLIPTGNKYDLVEAVFNPLPDGNGIVLDDGHLLLIPLADWQTGKPITIQAEVEVTPLVASIEYMPTVWAFEVVESEEYGETFWDNYIELEQPFLGRWAWETASEHWLWSRTNVVLKGVTFPNVHPGVETFSIESMFIDFGEGSNLDEITIAEALFSLAADTTYDLMSDDVTVIIDGVAITIPAGSFNKIGSPSSEKYIYNSKGTESVRVQMVMDFEVGEWSLIVRDIDADLVDNSDGITVIFAVGDSAAIERIYMQIGGLSYTADG